jgi:hypothetical protein
MLKRGWKKKMLEKDIRDSKQMNFDKFKRYYDKGIEKKEVFEELNKKLENSNQRNEKNLILDFLFVEYEKQKDDLLKYRILKLVNWFLYGKVKFDFYHKFKEKCFELLLSKNGNVRHNATHLVNNLRGHLLISCDPDMVYTMNVNYKFSEKEKENMRMSKDLLISSFFELIDIYENSQDNKIKKSLLKSIEHYYCNGMDEIIEGTSQEKVDIYNKFIDLIFGKEDENFNSFLEIPLNKSGFVFDYEKCDDIDKLKEHIKDLREMIVGLMEESDDLDRYIVELENKVKGLGGEL